MCEINMFKQSEPEYNCMLSCRIAMFINYKKKINKKP